MAGSLDGRARRVRHLETRQVSERPPATSRTLEEARALNAEIRELVAELGPAGGPACGADVGVAISADLDEQIAKLEEEIAHDSKASE